MVPGIYVCYFHIKLIVAWILIKFPKQVATQRLTYISEITFLQTQEIFLTAMLCVS